MKITSKSDLKFEYSILKWFEENLDKVDDKEKASKEIIKLKKAIRDYTNKPLSTDRVIKDNGFDGAIILQQLPDRLTSIDSAIEYFEEVEKYYYRPSPYDCTGQMFTTWYKVFKRNGKFYAYHSIAWDV